MGLELHCLQYVQAKKSGISIDEMYGFKADQYFTKKRKKEGEIDLETGSQKMFKFYYLK